MLNEYTMHSHTYRCGHAAENKDIEDYVTEAIKYGYKKYGVSDHVFLPGIICPWIRGDYSLLGEYIDEFNRCKTLYGKQIEMYLGFECEWSVCYKKYYESLLRDRGFDYLICGQHMGFNENFESYGYITDDLEHQEPGLLRYRDDIIGAIKSGLFLYIAHPDLFFMSCVEVTPLYAQITKEIIECAIEYNVPLEMNIHGILREKARKGVRYLEYPCEYFWSQAAKTKVKIVYGGDFHDPNEIERKDLAQAVEDMANRCNVKFASIDQVLKEYKERLQNLNLK